MGNNNKREKILQRLADLEAERTELEKQLVSIEENAVESISFPTDRSELSAEAKIKLFRSLFRGRTDVFPIRWENAKTLKSGYAIACENEWVRGICNKPRVKCSACEHKAFLPVTDDIIRFHLTGRDARQRPLCAGVYPMLPDETCWFLAADFDKNSWQTDVSAFVKTCDQVSIPVYIERSRSGNGAHAWYFFQEAVPAADARRLGKIGRASCRERVLRLV